MKLKAILTAAAAALTMPLCVMAQDESTVRNKAFQEGYDPLYPMITNVAARQTTSLCGTWDAIVDQYDNGFYNYRMKRNPDSNTFFADRHYYDDKTKLIEYDFNHSDKLQVPGDWNTQNDRLYYYEGSIWYRKVFDFKPQAGRRYFVRFGAVNYEGIVGLNGKVIGRHVGGFTPFNMEVTERLNDGSNSLIVKVNNNRHVDAVPTVNCDWWNYGGITREVEVIDVPQTFIRDYFVRLSDDTRNIEGWVLMDGPAAAGSKVTVNIPGLKYKVSAVADAQGKAIFSAKAKPELWSPANPKLYDVTVSSEWESLSDRIGFKTIRTEGTKLLLNGEPVFCKGISIHEEQIGENVGRAWSDEHARALLETARELGCNFVRLAHYPHNENMTRIADEMGIMVWSEIPVYWTISWTNEDTYANAQNQLEEMISRDRNRASIVIWSVSNETPRSPERLAFLSRLIDKAHELDPTRLVSSAMEKDQIGENLMTVNDELVEKSDILSFNEYVGWYDGDVAKARRSNWTFPVQKPVFISELGGGCLYGFHGRADERFTEEYLVELYKAQTEMMDRIPGLVGCTPWILKDFRSPRRQLHGIQDDFNRKGLVSEKGEKKDAFFVLKKWYDNK